MSERLYHQLERNYRRQGYEVLGLFSESGQLPPTWPTLPPDLLLQKQGRRTAIYRLKATEDIRTNLPAFRRLLADSNTDIRFLVDGHREQVEARRLLNEVGLSCEVALVHKGGRRRWLRLASPRGGWWKAVVFFVLLLVAVLLVWLVTLFYGYSPRYYEPRDLERKVKEWKQR